MATDHPMYIRQPINPMAATNDISCPIAEKLLNQRQREIEACMQRVLDVGGKDSADYNELLAAWRAIQAEKRILMNL